MGDTAAVPTVTWLKVENGITVGYTIEILTVIVLPGLLSGDQVLVTVT